MLPGAFLFVYFVPDLIMRFSSLSPMRSFGLSLAGLMAVVAVGRPRAVLRVFHLVLRLSGNGLSVLDEPDAARVVYGLGSVLVAALVLFAR